MRRRIAAYVLASAMTFLAWVVLAVLGGGERRCSAAQSDAGIRFTTQDIPSIGINNRQDDGGTQRRDPSDVIVLGDTYYVFYSRSLHSDWARYGWKGRRYLASGYYGTIWYATSKDGKKWTERGEALARGAAGKLDSNGVFSPNVIRASNGKVYMYYTGVPTGFANNNKSDYTYVFGAELTFDGKGGVSGAKRLNRGLPVLSPTARQTHAGKPLFDSYRVDDPVMLWRDYEGDGDLELGMYYKGRAESGTPGQTKMGVAIAESPEGPFKRHSGSTDGNVAQAAGHEVMVFVLGDGVVSLVSSVGHGVYFDKKGTKFAKIASFVGRIHAPGAYRPELTDPRHTGGVTWGISMVHNGDTPYLVRWDVKGPGTGSPWLGAVPPTAPASPVPRGKAAEKQ